MHWNVALDALSGSVSVLDRWLNNCKDALVSP